MLNSRLFSYLVVVFLLLARIGNAFVVVTSSGQTSHYLMAEPTSTDEAAAAADVSSTSAFTPNENDHEILSLSMFIDTTKELEKRPSSALSPEEMIIIAKRFLASKGGIGGDASMLSPTFTFEGPVVGPLSKDDFVSALGNVDFAKAFPDFQNEFYGFHVDPLEGDRVWYTARGKGKNTGPFIPFVPEATGTGVTVVNPPQVCSITIDHSTGLITKYTIGYVVDRNVGNTGGLGGLYGILYALGRPLPFPEAQPWKKSFQYDLVQKVGGLLRKLQ